MCCGSSLPNFRIFYCTISKGCEGMDLLQLCAQKYAELCYYTYDCTIARKNTAIDLHFTFSPYEFRHLAGLHRLEHDRLRSNSERVFKDILSCKLTLADLRQAHNWSTESEKILSRLEAHKDRRRLSYQIPASFWYHLFLFGQAEGRLLRALTFYQQRTGLQPRTDKIHLA